MPTSNLCQLREYGLVCLQNWHRTCYFTWNRIDTSSHNFNTHCSVIWPAIYLPQNVVFDTKFRISASDLSVMCNTPSYVHKSIVMKQSEQRSDKWSVIVSLWGINNPYLLLKQIQTNCKVWLKSSTNLEFELSCSTTVTAGYTIWFWRISNPQWLPTSVIAHHLQHTDANGTKTQRSQ